MVKDMLKYGGCSEGNTFYVTVLAHDIRGGYWWYGNRGWTFPPLLRSMLLLYDRRQQRGSVTTWHLTWKCVWRKGVSLNFSKGKKMAPIDIHWCLLNIYGDQTVGISTERWRVMHFSSNDSDMKDKPHSRWPCRFL